MKTKADQKRPHTTIAVFGSAFNPPHCGHEDVIQQALEHADLALLVPSYCHAFGKQMAPFEQRLAMTEALATNLSVAGEVRVSDIERTLSKHKANGKAIYTYDVLHALDAMNPNTSLIFVLGPDNAKPATWNKFYRAQDILNRWTIREAQERIAVRSTGIRNKLAQGILPTEDECPRVVIERLKTINYYYHSEDEGE